MARRKKRKELLDYVALPRLNLDPDTKKGIFVVLILAFGAIGILSLFELAGGLGVYLLKGMLLLFGWGRWIFPLIMLALGYLLYNEDKYDFSGKNYIGFLFFILSFHGLLNLLFIEYDKWQQAIKIGDGGGYIGVFFVTIFIKIMGFWASLLVLFCLLLISLMLIFNTGLSSLVGRESFIAKIFYPFNFIISKIFGRNKEEDEDEEIEDDEDSEENKDEEEEENDDEEEKEKEEDETENEDTDEEDGEMKFHAHKIKESVAIQDKVWEPTNIKIDLPLALLNGKVGKPTSGDIKNNSLIIQKTLENFGITVEMGEVSVGPTVTQYTFKPSDGIKLSKITGLNNDLSLALAAHPIRIEAPIPGKALVGVEVPNKAKAIVGLREVLSDKIFKERKTNLNIALGKDVSGKAWIDDLTKMPHLLVAGATGSGKSVMLNSIIISMFYQNNPDDLKFIMVDPKRVELPVYNGLPYLLTPVITEVGKTINALKWCLNEMDRRFEILSKSGKRNIASYNAVASNRMPYIVFIIDELADLMVAAARDVEGPIIRLAQMARAVGIHLILATQRPSVDVITGLIKANMPARIAFSVASSIDSRTILDSLGAEKLLGCGDMLFTSAEMSKPKRIQGAFVDDREIKKITRYIKDIAGAPNYEEGIVDRQKVQGIAGVGLTGASDSDDLLEEAKELIINSGKASASFLQRRLSVGYARAARLLDILEENGVVGPTNGSKPREILISKQDYDNMINQGISGVGLHNREETEAPDEYLESQDEEEEFNKDEIYTEDEEEDDDGRYFSR